MSEFTNFESAPEQSPQTRQYARAQKTRNRNGLLVFLIIFCLIAGIVLAVGVNNLTTEKATFGQMEATPEAIPTATPYLELGGTAPDITSFDNPVVAIAQNMNSAVVGVRTSVAAFEVGLPLQEVDYAYGSGFVVSKDGYIVTNHHVIADADRYTVILSDGTEYEAELIGSDTYSDIAVLKIDATDEDLTVSPIGDSDSVLVGELAVAIGSPLGEYLSNTVTVGYISAVNRDLDGSTFLQTDAAINPGNSGGPLMNSKGEVIGINALKAYLAGFDEYGIPIATEGIGFAIPINAAMEVVEQIISTGWVERPGIEISYYPMTSDDAYIWDVPFGALVDEVTPGGPADIAGIRVNDIITAVNSEDLEDPEALPDMIKDAGVGAKVTLSVWRETEKKRMDIDVTVGDLNALD